MTVTCRLHTHTHVHKPILRVVAISALETDHKVWATLQQKKERQQLISRLRLHFQNIAALHFRTIRFLYNFSG